MIYLYVALSLVQDYKVDDTSAIMLKFKNKAIGFVDSFFNIPDEASESVLELYGSRGCIKTKFTIGQSGGGEMVVCLQKTAKEYSAAQARGGAAFRKISLKPRNTYQAEIAEFSKAVLNDSKPPVSAEDALWNLKVMLAAYESSRLKKMIKLR